MFWLLYILISFAAAFTAQIICKYNDMEDDASVLFIGSMFFLWPIFLPLTLLVFLFMLMDKLASKAAIKMKQK